MMDWDITHNYIATLIKKRMPHPTLKSPVQINQLRTQFQQQRPSKLAIPNNTDENDKKNTKSKHPVAKRVRCDYELSKKKQGQLR